jgi:hypothetical protein
VKLAFAMLGTLSACAASTDRTDPPAATASQLVTKSNTSSGPQGCALNAPGSKIQHIIALQFDNVHFTRDSPNVPSDLEQMPNLRNFLTQNGTLSNNHHTPLKSHTADDVITTITGVYGAKHGQPIANSFSYFPAPGTSTALDKFTSSFEYWTDIVNTSTPSLDPSYYMVTPDGKNAPAPWVAYTSAGCNFGAVSTANIELENVGSDVAAAFGGNPTLLAQIQAEVKANRSQAIADIEGIAIHCGQGDPLCANATGGVPDVLPQEPGGYSGYSALFGHKFVAPVISPDGPLLDLDGNVIQDSSGHVGFPGFGPISAAQSLGYVAAMQEHGVPVTFAYIADAHDDHSGKYNRAFGPGEVGYTAQLQAYDRAFGEFFTRLANDGITPANTLFVITADEGDHFAGGPASPDGCDGVNVACTYAKLGEVDTNMPALLNGFDSTLAATPFDITFDDAPAFYIKGNPAPGSAIVRQYERDVAQLTAVSPITGNTDTLTQYLVDPVEMHLLHMVTGDPQRTPNFVMFGDPDYFFQTFGTPTFNESNGFAWNHGGTSPEVVTTWLGLVGPGVKVKGVDSSVWSDHTDIRPTILLLAGLQSDYTHDGVALIDDLEDSALPSYLQTGGSGPGRTGFDLIAAAYKRIYAPVGPLGMTTLALSTTALAGDDATYARLETALSNVTTQRDAIAAQMIAALEAAEFGGTSVPPSAQKLVGKADSLLTNVQLMH